MRKGRFGALFSVKMKKICRNNGIRLRMSFIFRNFVATFSVRICVMCMCVQKRKTKQ